MWKVKNVKKNDAWNFLEKNKYTELSELNSRGLFRLNWSPLKEGFILYIVKMVYKL